MVTGSLEQFGDYELVRRLGVGGMAETFLALRRGPAGFEQRVCLKRILATLQSDPEFVQMFLAEARLSALLHHRHIARVLDFGLIDDAHYLTLELIEGTDLRHLLAHLRAHGKALDSRLTAYIAVALASALDFAHTVDENGRVTGVVHRDVSPSNVLLSYAGEIKLADFGIAKSMAAPSSVQSAALKGKIPYMAPEYALERHYDARTDLFSLGVLLFECLAATRPFDAENDVETIQRARRGERETLASLAPDAPRALVEAVEWLLEPEPRDRPRDAGALLDALAQVPPPPLCRRYLAEVVRETTSKGPMPVAPGLASTRPLTTRRPRKRLPSRG